MKKSKRYQFKKKFIKTIERRVVRQLIMLSKKDTPEEFWKIGVLKKSDRFFNDSENLNDTFINRGTIINETHFPDSYFYTSMLLITMMQITNSNSIRDGLIYPALFSFRHYLELTLKETLNLFECSGHLSEEVILREHSIQKLWNKIKTFPLIDDGPEIEIVQNLLFEFNRIDPNGELFRYPYEIGKEGYKLTSSLPSGLYEIRTLKETMIKVYRFLDGINTLAYEYSNR